MDDGRPFFLKLFNSVNTFLDLTNGFEKEDYGMNVYVVLTVLIYTIFEKEKDIISEKKIIIIDIEKTELSTLRCDGI